MLDINFLNITLEWSRDLANSYLNNWDSSANWTPTNPMPSFLITFTNSEDGDILAPDFPYFLDFENGSLLGAIQNSKKEWGNIIANVLRERKPLFYLVVSETAYMTHQEQVLKNGVMILLVGNDFYKAVIGDIQKTDAGVVISQLDIEVDKRTATSDFFKGLIHYDLGFSSILQ